jgi:hypothetical protein
MDLSQNSRRPRNTWGRQGTKEIALHFGDMRRLWRALDARVRQYYSVLLNDVLQELVQVLQRQLSNREAPNKDDPKIDRVRPGGVPHECPSLGGARLLSEQRYCRSSSDKLPRIGILWPDRTAIDSTEQPLFIPASPWPELQFGADVVARPRDVVPAQEAMQESVLLGLQVVAGGEKGLQDLIDFLREIDVY